MFLITTTATLLAFHLPSTTLPAVQRARSPPVLASITISEPSEDRARALDITTWLFQAVGEATFDGVGVYGDSFGSISPATSDRQLSETLGEGCFRYVLAGTGKVVADGGEKVTVGPNTLLQVSSSSVELVWTLDDGCDVMVLGAPEYDSPARRAVRAALPYVGGALAAVGVVALASEGLSGNW